MQTQTFLYVCIGGMHTYYVSAKVLHELLFYYIYTTFFCLLFSLSHTSATTFMYACPLCMHMAKNVALSDPLVARLDQIRQQFGISYSDAIAMITVQQDADLAIIAINKRFAELTSLLPDMEPIWESLNLVAVHMHRLPPQTRIDQTTIVVTDVMKIVEYLVNTKQEAPSNDTK